LETNKKSPEGKDPVSAAWGWDALISVCATVSALFPPTVLVLNLPMRTGLVLLAWLVTAIFVVDIVIRYRRHDSLGAVAADVLAAVPFYLISGGPTAWQLLRLLKLFRVAQFLRQWRYHDIEHSNLLRLVFFLYWMGLSTHWIACGWIALRAPAGEAGPWSRYLDALYWCVTTLSTVGYGDVTPENAVQKIFTMGVMVLGVGVYGFIIGNIATILVNIDPARANYLQRMEQLAAFMNYRNIPVSLRERLAEYYRYMWDQRLDHDESEILGRLPPSLNTEIAMFLKRDLLESVPLFQGASEAFIREIALQLKPLVFMPGDFAIRAGDMGRSMYFISRGTMEVLSPDSKTTYTTMSSGDFFGEIALLYDEPRSASVRALEYCDVYRLDRELLERVLNQYPEIAEKIKAVAKERYDKQ
jgi:voltage-gated potassium channel